MAVLASTNGQATQRGTPAEIKLIAAGQVVNADGIAGDPDQSLAAKPVENQGLNIIGKDVGSFCSRIDGGGGRYQDFGFATVVLASAGAAAFAIPHNVSPAM